MIFYKKVGLIFIATILVFLIYFFSPNKIEISEVIDGDTVKLSTGEYVRLLGINAPEKGQKFYEEAKIRLEELLRDSNIKLESDFENSDKYGRLLRYLYANETLVNLQLVREGYAKPYLLENLKYKLEIEEAWKECLQEKLNLCNFTETCNNLCIGLAYINWNAQGNDCDNPNGEYVIFKNYCNISCNLTNWKVTDSSNNTFLFPNFILKPFSKVIIYSGAGENKGNELYWNKLGRCKAVWDNSCDGDTVNLVNSNGSLVLTCRYRGFC
jgi:micrococcal nuclease